jgi:two-component system sensor histidine kinase/response regulator
MAAILPTELTDLFTELAQSSTTNRLLLSRLLLGLSKSLLDSLMLVSDKVQALRQNTLAPEQQANALAQIQRANTELLTLANNLINYSQTHLDTTKNSEATATATIPPSQELKGVRILIADDDAPRRERLLKQLHSLGLQATETTADQAVSILREAEQTHAPYQIAIISAESFDHHVAYLARTIKGSPQLTRVMLALALPTQLLGFEKERAYFGGFTCVLNFTNPARTMEKLVNSWRGWSAKVNFTRVETPLNQNRILLVEDDPIPQKITLRQLGDLGYEVDIAADGHTALKLLEQKQYSLVFMDVGLPDISGLEVTAEFRKRENGGHRTPIVGLTIYALESDEEHGLQAGMDEYLVKPLLHDRLRSVLDRWLTNAKSNSAP